MDCNDRTPVAGTTLGPDVYWYLYGFYDPVMQSVIRSDYYPSPNSFGISSVVLPVCEYIGSAAFFGCQIDYADLGNCSFIGRDAFTPYYHFFTMVLRGSSVCRYGGNQVYDMCSSLGMTSIYVPSSLVSEYKSAYQWSKLSSSIFPIPSSMTS